MNVRATAWLVILFAIAKTAGAADALTLQPSIWERSDRGFAWYGREATRPENKARPPLESLSNKELGAAVERLLDEAIENPTPERVEDYLHAQKIAMDRATVFSDVFRRTVWTDPDLDYGFKHRPANAMALASYDNSRDQQRANTIRGLAQSHGMYFFYRSDCPYCHHMSKILRMVQEQFGLEILAVSMDGSSIPEFPTATLDNGASKTLGVRGVPAVFIVNRQSKKIQPVGYGVLSQEELINRIHVLTQTTPGQEY